MTEETEISSVFPPPPPFLRFFTPENTTRLKELKRKRSNDTLKESDLAEDDMQLRFLIPPEQPEGEIYRSFGNVWQFNERIPSLEDQGITKLYRDSTSPTRASDTKKEAQHRISELKRLLKSLLLNFVEVVSVVTVDPKQFATKVDNIRMILINMHHLLNEYRPHQSRESLILLMETQIEQKQSEIAEIERVCKEVEKNIEGLVKLYVDEQSEETSDDENGDKGFDNMDIDITDVVP